MDALDAALGVSQPIPNIGEVLAFQVLEIAYGTLNRRELCPLHEAAVFRHSWHLGDASAGFPVIRIHFPTLIWGQKLPRFHL